jgi:hypothetical protein
LVHDNLVGDDGNGTVTTTAVISSRVLRRPGGGTGERQTRGHVHALNESLGSSGALALRLKDRLLRSMGGGAT